MIVELTLLTDDGKPYIADGATCFITLTEKGKSQIRINGEVHANKVTYYVPTGESNEPK